MANCAGERSAGAKDESSCGVLVLAVADCIALGAATTFTQDDVPVLRQRLALSLYSDDLTARSHV